jgi:hypothetical protein
MAREQFTPLDFSVPQNTELGNYVVVPISTKDVDDDLRALLANADIITQQRGGDGDRNKWPYTFTREENFIDLAWLETCVKNGQLFVYILRNKTDNAYAGCVCIYPIELYFPERAIDYDVDFSFWITKKKYIQGMYEEMFIRLLDWLKKDWPFRQNRIYLRNKEVPDSLKQSL